MTGSFHSAPRGPLPRAGRLALALALALAPAPFVLAAPASGASEASPGVVGGVAADAGMAADPGEPAGAGAPSDPRHATDGSSDRHVKDLDSVVVTATPLRDTAAELSKPTDVLSGERLDEQRASSLGETISSIPGVQSSNFGPGVGRPILRGLDGPRVGVLSGGLSTQDVSTVSQDHAPAIEPFLADQIEVLKGPATLLYGSGAIGGVVNVVDGRIPELAIDSGFSGRAELRHDSGSRADTGMVRVDGGSERFALHADAVRRDAGDYATPDGRQANSFVDSRSGALGGSLVGDWGFLGASASRYENRYGNPGEPGDTAAGIGAVSIRLRQDRFELKGALTEPWGAGSGVRAALAHTDYAHIEFEGSDRGTTFSNRADEGRVELAHVFADGWKAAAGVQASDATFAAVGEESFVPRTRTRAVGVFALARRSWEQAQFDIGARIDDVASDPDGIDGRRFNPASVSVSGGYRFAPQWRMTASFDHAERAPAPEELFADGPHLATLAYEIGDPLLGKEAANQLELGLQYQGPKVDAKLAAYYNRFQDFIYLRETGDEVAVGDAGETLPVRQWSQRDARFRGLEAEATFHLADNASGRWDLRAFGDTVRATLVDGGGNVPRIAPSRLGTQLRWEGNAWRAALGATRVARQGDVAGNETPTAGYTLVDAHVTYHADAGRLGWELFLDGSNLTDTTARVHTSFLKDDVVLAGRSISAGVRVFF